MLSRLSTRSVQTFSRSFAPLLSSSSSSVSLFSTGTFDKKERGEETVFFRQQEERQLKKLMEKMQKKEDKGRDELRAILGSNTLPEEVIEKLLDWKYHD